jgi:hypothetical protein
MKKLALVLTLVSVATIASAAVVEDFESGWAGDGALVADPAGGAGTALFLDADTTQVDVARIVLPTPGEGVLTVDVYDPGLISETGDAQGPRWGVAGMMPLQNAVMAAMMDKSFLGSEVGYAYTAVPGADAGNNGPTSVFNWFSPSFFGGPRQSNAWTTWTFTVHADQLVTIEAFGTSMTTTAAMPGGGVEFIACGGSGSTNTNRPGLNGFYVDNVAWTPVPEPMTLSLLALGGLGLIRRRRA